MLSYRIGKEKESTVGAANGRPGDIWHRMHMRMRNARPYTNAMLYSCQAYLVTNICGAVLSTVIRKFVSG